ncbi:Uncharacterised protein [Mycobacterium tuberculosis]|nr:Uncharacterised protein [Mycobacterium tuberculosis]
MPTPRKKCPRRSPSAAPPDTAYCTLPPTAARSFPYTRTSKTLCLALSPSPGPPASRARL